MLEGEKLPGAAKSGLNLVKNQQCAFFPCNTPRRTYKLEVCRTHPTFALNGFEDDRRCLLSDGGLEFGNIAVGHELNVLVVYCRAKGFTVFGFVGQGQCAQGTSRKAAFHAHKAGAPICGGNGKFLGGFYRLGARVTQENPVQPAGQHTHQLLEKLGPLVVG